MCFLRSWSPVLVFKTQMRGEVYIAVYVPCRYAVLTVHEAHSTQRYKRDTHSVKVMRCKSDGWNLKQKEPSPWMHNISLGIVWIPLHVYISAAKIVFNSTWRQRTFFSFYSWTDKIEYVLIYEIWYVANIIETFSLVIIVTNLSFEEPPWCR